MWRICKFVICNQLLLCQSLSIYLSASLDAVSLPIYRSVGLSVCIYVYLSVYLCICLFISICTCLSIHLLSVCPYVCLSIWLCLCQCICLSVCMSFCMSIKLSVCSFICMSVCILWKFITRAMSSFMIESEAWNVSLKLFKGHGGKVDFYISSEGVKGRWSDYVIW